MHQSKPWLRSGQKTQCVNLSQDKARCVNLMREGTMGRNPRGPMRGAVKGGFDGKWDDTEKAI